MSVTIENLAEYIFRYISEYRETFEAFTCPPPTGAGYPKVNISPFLTSKEFDIYLAKTGVVISEVGEEPKYQWYIAGGPALKVDVEPTKTPPEVFQIIKNNNLDGKPIGIYRIVSKKHIPNYVWRGRIKNVSVEKSINNTNLNVTLNLRKVETNLEELVCNLTFGAYGIVLDPHLPKKDSPFGEPHITEQMGFFPADLNNRRYFNYLEVYGYEDESGWDNRNIKLRVKNDLRRDFVKKMSHPDGESGGLMSFGSSNGWVENYTNRLGILKQAIDEFRDILQFQSYGTEDVFHKLIERHPILLDVYGSCESKPKLKYPNGDTSPIGKKYLEPDFIVSYPDQSYKLVELERASKNIVTSQGQPRAEVGQAVFQTAEWIHFIREYYSEIKNKYPGIHTKCRKCVIMSRSSQSSFKGVSDMGRYKEIIMSQYAIDEILTYDDLFERACSAYTILTGLSPHNI
ncbi:Shedu anti-phage system protein SduA domain-containing protein [Aeromonas dhakensis]|uniref:Shedu anti-phage system protein SduA domain-containing protein n=1 Tax=Aeromonas dhakensis TaxID=196024 RepID=UPI0038D0AAE6